MFKTGQAIRNITPDFPCPLLGFGERQEIYPDAHDAVLDPIYLRALCIQQDDHAPLIYISLDIATLQTESAQALRSIAAETAGTSLDHVIIACTHTHSAPFPVFPQQDSTALDEDTDPGNPKRDRWHEPGRAFQILLEKEVQIAVKAAIMLIYPVDLYTQSTELGLSYVRRCVDPQTGELEFCWNPKEQSHLPLKPGPDPSLDLLIFRDHSGTRSQILWSLGAHNLCLGKTSNVISADWVGQANQRIADSVPGSFPLFAFGACGETHPWIATQDDPELISPIAETAAGMVTSLTHAARPAPCTELKVKSESFTFGELEVDATLWAFGKVILIALPVELFQSLSLRLRQQHPELTLLMVTEANGRTGYWPDAQAFSEGGYEVEIALNYGLKAGDGEKLMDQISTLISEFG